MSVQKGLLVDAANALHVADVESVLVAVAAFAGSMKRSPPASSKGPTFAQMTFRSLVISGSFQNAEAGRCEPRPLLARPQLSRNLVTPTIRSRHNL